MGDRNISSDEGLFSILDTITGPPDTILDVFSEASGVIPVPFVRPLVGSVVELFKVVKVNLQILVSY